jgi:N utilization substance protein B
MRVLQTLFSTLRVSPTNRPYAEVLVRLVAVNLKQVDEIVLDALTNWRMERLAAIDRNVLRLGVAEMLFVDDVPPRITIREMMQLAEKYGTHESPRFVTGVLDAVMRRVAPEAASGPR